MTFRIKVRREGEAFEAWAPELHECRAIGATEDEAIERLHETIREELLFHEHHKPSAKEIAERTIEVEVSPIQKQEVFAALPDAPTAEGIRAHLWLGILLALVGLTGILFSFMAGYAQAPWLLFAPISVLAFGILGVVMAIAKSGSTRRRA